MPTGSMMVLTSNFVPNRLFDQAEKMSRLTRLVLNRELMRSVKNPAYLKYERKPRRITRLVTSQNLLPALVPARPVMMAVKKVSRVVSSRSMMNSPPVR
ncbi:MAG: hypothetical protein BWY89_02043 [Bacteroidetes bacterium ADurb.BinA012]|nr:MAG: hypothetical protein BWY89_02043 [Bacteroidetes bacterium ADurb.BinA012]